MTPQGTKKRLAQDRLLYPISWFVATLCIKSPSDARHPKLAWADVGPQAAGADVELPAEGGLVLHSPLGGLLKPYPQNLTRGLVSHYP